MTHMSEILNDVMEQVGKGTKTGFLRILETGSIRGDTENYRLGDGWSTLTFAKRIVAYGGSLTSVDLNVNTAHKVLSENGLLGEAEINLIPDYSVNRLAQILSEAKGERPYDVILLDSDNNADLILHEYMIARLLVKPEGVILVDDVDTNSDTVLKGHSLIPWLNANQIGYTLRSRSGGGHSTGVLIIG